VKTFGRSPILLPALPGDRVGGDYPLPPLLEGFTVRSHRVWGPHEFAVDNTAQGPYFRAPITGMPLR